VIGHFTFVLHAHLPYVLGHGRWPHGTEWLQEAAAETYVPLLDELGALVDEGVHPGITMGITPVLAEQLADGSFPDQFLAYLQSRVAAAKRDHAEFVGHNRLRLARIAEHWGEHFDRVGRRFEQQHGGDLIGSFRKLQDDGHIEIITSAATHGYLPLLGTDANVRAQVRVGVEYYKQHFGRAPSGFWLPECAYRPRYRWRRPVSSTHEFTRQGVEEILSENGLEYFFVDSALVQGGRSVGVYLDRFPALRKLWKQFEKTYRERPPQAERTCLEPHYVHSEAPDIRPVVALARHPETALQVWSGEWGYPGDGWYLEFHKRHYPGGHRYWRVTSSKTDLAEKEEYEPDRVGGRIRENADHFVSVVKQSLAEYHSRTGKQGLLVAPYDAELFGHWWHEGVLWLGEVVRRIHADPEIGLTSCGAYLREHPPEVVLSLPEGSWGQGGFHYIWLNEETEWTWRHVYEAEDLMRRLITESKSSRDDELKAVLRQAARELLLLEASDWAFLISTWAARDYAESRVVEHHASFKQLAEMATTLMKGQQLRPGQKNLLSALSHRDRLFPNLQLDWFAGQDDAG
jgi:1,4-alpha-glucan branching enzyme